ncbi:MAG: hypothetical protein AB1598_07700 [Thermodesulfobacteriota bacterium]
MNFEISRYSCDSENHIDQIARLKTINWGLDFDVFRSYAKWNYLDRPHSKPPLIYFVRLGEETVAMRGAYETTWQVNNASPRFHAFCSADLLILQEYRNKGLYKEFASYVMEDLCKMGVRYFFSFTATPLNSIISLSIGWKAIGKINVMEKQFQTNRSKAISLAKNLAGPRAIQLLKKARLNLILKRRRKDDPQKNDVIDNRARTQLPSSITLENRPRPLEMARLVDSTRPKDKITLVRDESFFDWRYNNPLSKYRFLYWYDDGLKGYLVLQSHLYSLESLGTYNIFELEAINSSVKIDLLNAVISIINEGSITVWTNMLDQDSYEFLVSNGFKEKNSAKIINETTRTMLIRPIGKHDDKIEFQGLNLLDADNWDFKMILMHDH